MTANFTNRTLWTGDNLDIMRGINSESVDLIYLDPPFNSNRNYAAPIGSEAAGAAFKDTWTLDDVDLAWHGLIAEEHPGLYSIIDAAGVAYAKGMKSYLIMMAVRLLEMRRVLKPTGSIYLHCDPTASHYLKLLMDAVFGPDNFRNEIVWERTLPKGLMTRRLPTSHDLLLVYQRSESATWNIDAVFLPYDENRLDEKTRNQYSLRDPDGRRYQLTSLLNPNKDRPNLTYEFLGVTRVWRWTKERMQDAYERGLVVQSAPGRAPRYKRFLDEQRGRPLSDVWTDTPPASGNESIGYPTQKPLALLERIIKAGSNTGDAVLDPFCGCATTLIAAEKLERQWIGIDLSPVARTLVARRLEKELGLFGLQTVYREDIPQRTDLGQLPRYQTHKHTLYGRQEGICAGCKVLFPFRNFTIDHIIPQSNGGTDHIDNLQLLCGACNSVKDTFSQAEFLAKLNA